MTFEKDGYILLKGVFEENYLSQIRSKIDELIAYSQKELDDPLDEHFLKHRVDNGVLYDVYQRHPFFRPMAENPVLLDEVEKILGANFYLYVNSLLYKPKSKNNEVPWHQDFLSRPNESEKILTWMAIDNATKENGCLKVIPGSHKKGFRDWYRVKGATHHDRIKIDEKELQNASYVEMKAGDVLVFSNYLIHSSDENNSDLPRRAFRAVFKKLDDAKIPRGAPIMMRSNLNLEKVGQFKTQQKSTAKKLLNRIGNYLSTI